MIPFSARPHPDAPNVLQVWDPSLQAWQTVPNARCSFRREETNVMLGKTVRTYDAEFVQELAVPGSKGAMLESGSTEAPLVSEPAVTDENETAAG